MSTNEILVSVVCVLVGYWVISALLAQKKPPAAAEKNQNSDNFSARQAPPGPGSRKPAWYEVLQVPPTATLEQVQSARRSLMSQYHPDKVANLGHEFRLLAEEKSKAVNQAYNEALAELGGRPWT